MSSYDYDLFVLGAGSGGVRGGRIASTLGARVGMCEEYRVGGTCVIRGCVPKKLMVYASEYSHAFSDAAAYGWSESDPTFDWPAFIARKDKEIDRLNGIYHGILDRAGVELLDGRGVFVDAHTIQVGERTVTAERVLIATGAWPSKPDIPGAELAISSNEVFHLPKQPQRVLVYGGGYIAVEFAGIFHGLGSATTLVYRGDKVLRGFDDDVRDALTDALDRSSMDLRLNRSIASLSKTNDGIRVHYDDGSGQTVDTVLFATGRRPNIAGLNLQRIGVELNRGAIAVDEFSRTSVPHIYAVGDVTDRMNLTPVALMEGQRFAQTVYGGQQLAVDHEFVPSAVFSQPEVASVGYTEEAARARFGQLDVYLSSFKPLRATLSGRDEKMLIKLLVEQAGQRVVGCHIVGEHAAEMMQSVAIAMKMGATKAQFDQTIGIHPSAAEELVTMREKTR